MHQDPENHRIRCEWTTSQFCISVPAPTSPFCSLQNVMLNLLTFSKRAFCFREALPTYGTLPKSCLKINNQCMLEVREDLVGWIKGCLPIMRGPQEAQEVQSSLSQTQSHTNNHTWCTTCGNMSAMVHYIAKGCMRKEESSFQNVCLDMEHTFF